MRMGNAHTLCVPPLTVSSEVNKLTTYKIFFCVKSTVVIRKIYCKNCSSYLPIVSLLQNYSSVNVCLQNSL